MGAARPTLLFRDTSPVYYNHTHTLQLQVRFEDPTPPKLQKFHSCLLQWLGAMDLDGETLVNESYGTMENPKVRTWPQCNTYRH